MTRHARAPLRWILRVLVALGVVGGAPGCGGPEPAPSGATQVSSPRDTPELGRPRPKLLPPEAAAGTTRAEAGR